MLPRPTVDALAHSERLTQALKQLIQSRGWISFSEFMQYALYAPGLGYYVAGSRKFGASGDFVTAPEISSSFSSCLALQCRQIFEDFDAPSILECGAGSGVMAADILLALENLQALPRQYFILEISPDLEERQRQIFQEKCPHLLGLISWLSVWPNEFEGVVLANEVLDAMPVHCFEINNQTLCERGVNILNQQFVWETKKEIEFRLVKDFFSSEIGSFLPEGYISEICFAIKSWLASLYASMKRGIILLIDYGFPQHEYYHPDRNQGTLMCHYRHYAHTDPFIYVGLQDLTAHVDFTAVARAANSCGFSIAGYTNQANFLMSLGILSNTNHDLLNTFQQYQQAQAIKKLLLPSEMGELFKVIALSKNIDMPLLGFQLKNDAHRLF